MTRAERVRLIGGSPVFVFEGLRNTRLMAEYLHQRHKTPQQLPAGCQLVLACPPLRSNVNLSRIVRAASCCGVQRMIACGRPKVDPKIARDGAERVFLEAHRTLPPVLKRLQGEGFQLVGLEQTSNSVCLYDFSLSTADGAGHWP